MRTIFYLALLLCWVPFSAQEYSISSIPKELLENSNSVVLEEDVEIDATDIAKIKTTTRRVVAVLNQLGDDDISLREYYDENSRVRKIEVQIYNALGKRIDRFKKKGFGDASRAGGNMYMDSRVLFMNYTPTSYPYIVVFESETESGDSALLSPWVPLRGYAESTQKSRLRIKFNPENKPRYKVKNLEGYDISISETPEDLTLTASHLQAIRYEEHSPNFFDVLPLVYIAFDNFHLKGIAGSATNWQEFGSWMENELLADMRDLPEATILRAKNLVVNETTNERKARVIYQYVQDKVRYISIQIGIGGWQPMPASEVDRLGYGDCKALTNYTKALLDAVGVPTYYTVVYGHRAKWDIIDDFASIQGNHVILGVPDGDEITWLECTSQDTPYGYIAGFTDDRDVLVLTPEGGKIVRTKIYETEGNTQDNHSRVKIDAKGSVLVDFQSISQGVQYNSKYSLTKKRRESVDSYYKNRWSNINGFLISDFKFSDDREDIVFTESLSLDIPRYANSVGNDFLFCPNLFNQRTYVPPLIETRIQKLNLAHGFVDTDTVEVEIPAGFEIAGLPESSVLETEFGKYEISFTQIAENKMIYFRYLRLEKGEYPASEYSSYRDFMRSVVRLDKTKFLLKQSLP